MTPRSTEPRPSLRQTIARVVAGIGFPVLLSTGAAPAWGQAANIGVAAEISTTALSVAQQNDLNFGNVVPGTPVTINPRNSPNAGLFEIHGNRNAEVSITFTLPAVLRAGTGPLTMAIAFGATSGCHVPLLEGLRFICTNFNPNIPLVRRIGNGGNPLNAIFVWIGGTVTPTAVQAPAIYTGTITMFVVYTGN